MNTTGLEDQTHSKTEATLDAQTSNGNASTIGDSNSAEENSMKEESKSQEDQVSQGSDSSQVSPTNEGVKILEEVLKNTSIVPPKTEENKGQQVPIGPAIPTLTDYDPAELKKAEEFKEKGNEYFASKYNFLV
jgi:hypothetical protein